MQKKALLRVVCALVIVLLTFPLGCFGEEAASTRWADAADEIEGMTEEADIFE